jgi:tetratricopeptide (TPR) repeat protein
MTRFRLVAFLSGLAFGIVAFAIGGTSWNAQTRPDGLQRVPIFPGLGSHTRRIATRPPSAQRYFDQGLMFLYAFDHAQARRSFQAAAQKDEGCAMCYWGIAMANGPHINDMKIEDQRSTAAVQALERARALVRSENRTEALLIEAASVRFSDPAPSDRKQLDESYAAAMRRVLTAVPDDPDVGALTAEALMDLRPWDLWTRDGHPQPGTEEIVGILESVLSRAPQHPFALHLLIHVLDDSPMPERAAGAAYKLRQLAPGLQHLLHMSSHIDLRLGNWEDAVVANEKAIAASNAQRLLCPHEPINFLFVNHNYHALAFAAVMQGQSHKAIDAMRTLLSNIPADYYHGRPQAVDGFFALPYELHLRVGRWDDMLAEPKPKLAFPISTALWHFGRGISFAAQKKVNEALAEHQAFLDAVKGVPATARFRNAPAEQILGIADKMLAGEIHYRRGEIEPAIKDLTEAINREDLLPFSEPPNWMMPVRHALGAVLVDASRYSEAEFVYRADLARYPKNGWSLFGLAHCLKMEGKTAGAALAAKQLKKIWKNADVKLSSSCCCLPFKK